MIPILSSAKHAKRREKLRGQANNGFPFFVCLACFAGDSWADVDQLISDFLSRHLACLAGDSCLLPAKHAKRREKIGEGYQTGIFLFCLFLSGDLAYFAGRTFLSFVYRVSRAVLLLSGSPFFRAWRRGETDIFACGKMARNDLGVRCGDYFYELWDNLLPL